MSMMSEPRAIATQCEKGVPTQSPVDSMWFTLNGTQYMGLAIDGKRVTWRNYEYINGVLHSVFEIV